MDPLIVMGMVLGVVGAGISVWWKSQVDTPQSTRTPAGRGQTFVKMETVMVDHPRQLSAEIERVRSNHIRNGLVIGEPQVTADGCTANVPIFRLG